MTDRNKAFNIIYIPISLASYHTVEALSRGEAPGHLQELVSRLRYRVSYLPLFRTDQTVLVHM